MMVLKNIITLSGEWKTITRLNNEMNLSERTIYRLMQELRDNGFTVEKNIYGKFKITSFPVEFTEIIGNISSSIKRKKTNVWDRS